MRFLPLLCASLLGFGLPAMGQVQEKTLSERLNVNPNKDPFENNLAGKKFTGSADIELDKKSGTMSSYQGVKSFGAADFTTRSFFGIKNPWFGKKVYGAEQANLPGLPKMKNANSNFQTENAQVKNFQDGNKTLPSQDAVGSSQTASVQGKAQGTVSNTKKDLSIDDVREILNKNR